MSRKGISPQRLARLRWQPVDSVGEVSDRRPVTALDLEVHMSTDAPDRPPPPDDELDEGRESPNDPSDELGPDLGEGDDPADELGPDLGEGPADELGPDL
jgi:hypothetical protein